LLLKLGGQRVLIDAGDGAFRQLATWDAPKRLDLIIITALTTERLGGLATILDNPALQTTRRPPLVAGPVGTAAAVKRMAELMSDGTRLSPVLEVEDEEELAVEDASLALTVLDIGRAKPALGVRLTEPDAPGRFDVLAAQRLGLEPGPAFSRLSRGETVDGVAPEDVMGPPRPGRRLAVLGPCRPTERATAQATNARALFVVAPYIEERQEVAAETGVMTGAEAALLATHAQAQTLVLMHLGGAIRAGYARREAAQFHRRVFVPSDGERFLVPMPDVGPVERRPAPAGVRVSGPRGNV
jgi:ribonuclease Z